MNSLSSATSMEIDSESPSATTNSRSIRSERRENRPGTFKAAPFIHILERETPEEIAKRRRAQAIQASRDRLAARDRTMAQAAALMVSLLQMIIQNGNNSQ